MPVYGPHKSAIVILGADDDIGRKIVLQFSDLGYTVFAVFPNHNESFSGQPEDSKKTSKVASLLYTWHRMRESKISKSRDTSGFVIPLFLDSSSQTQRTRMYETVQVYCTSHSLRLVALIASTPGSYDHPASPSQESSPDAFARSRLYDRKPSFDVLGSDVNEVVARELTEPLLLVQDYLKMLQLARGRVLVISGCSMSSSTGFGPSLDNARIAISETIGNKLALYGVSVTSIISGPVLPDSEELNRIASGVPVTVPVVKISKLVEDALSPFLIPEAELLSVVQRVMMTRYPKSRYIIGLHPYLQIVFDLEIVKLCVKFCIKQGLV